MFMVVTNVILTPETDYKLTPIGLPSVTYSVSHKLGKLYLWKATWIYIEAKTKKKERSW
jgi:hypothetical protein